MKTVLVVVFLLLAISGCSDADGMANVQKFYKTSEVIMVPDQSGCFIARKKDGSIWYACSSGMTEASINHVQLLPPTEARN